MEPKRERGPSKFAGPLASQGEPQAIDMKRTQVNPIYKAHSPLKTSSKFDPWLLPPAAYPSSNK